MGVVSITFPGNLTQVTTADGLRGLPSFNLTNGQIAGVVELASEYAWDPSSLAADDGATVIRPSDTGPLQVGRWRLYSGAGTGGGGGGGGATVTTLAELKAADTGVNPVNLTANGLEGAFFFREGNFTDLANDYTIVASDTTPIFNGAWVRNAPIIYVKDFGVVGDGVADDTAALQLAFDSAPDGAQVVYNVTQVRQTAKITLTNRKSLIVSGGGCKLVTTTKFADGYFRLDGCDNIHIRDFVVDQGKTALPAYSAGDYPQPFNGFVRAENCSNLTLTGNRCSNLYSVAVWLYAVSGVNLFSGNEFLSPAQTQMLRMEHILIQTCPGAFNIRDNRFDGVTPAGPAVAPCAVFIAGLTGSALITGNRIRGCGRNNDGTHRVAAIDVYGDAQNVRVVDNDIEDVMAEAIRMSTMRNGIVRGNRIGLNANCEGGRSIISVESTALYPTGQVGCEDFTISDNIFSDPFLRSGNCIGLYAYDWGTPLRNITVKDNKQKGGYSFIRGGGPFYNVNIVGNTASGGRCNILWFPAPGGITLGTTAGTEANSMFDRMTVSGNSLFDQEGAGANPINVSLDSTTTAYVGTVDIHDNKCRASPASAGAGIVVRLRSSTPGNGRANLRRNETRGYAFPFDVNYTGELMLTDNAAAAGFTTFFLDGGSNLNITRDRNRHSSGPMQGKATLAAGVADVATSEVRAGDVIELTRLNGIGANGFLVIESISDGSGFQIRSKDAANALVTTDTSVIAWRIRH